MILAGQDTRVGAATRSARTTAGARWRMAFWFAWGFSQIVRIALAANLAPFGDEAWYWQESRALDWSYSDLPLATAWLIRLGEMVFGHGVFAMRAPFLLLGALVPFVLIRTGNRVFGSPAGWQAGLLALALPLLGTLGIFALPDVPLTLCWVVAFDALESAMRTRDRRAWTLLGVALAGAWLSHYRAGMLILTGLAFLAFTPRGRQSWRDPGLWLAVGISLLGLIPLVMFNVEHGWVALGFQLVERNPWSFHADALVQPIEQAIVCTPLFYLLLLWAAVGAARRANAGEPWDLLAVCTLVPIVGYFVLGCFADDTRLRLHWPLPGYLPLLLALPVLLGERGGAHDSVLRRASLASAFALLLLGCCLAYGYLALAATPGGAGVLTRFKAFPEHWVGWNEVAEETRARLARPEFAQAVLVADNFMLAAELDFAFGGTRTVYTLDHPINVKHGRAPQLALWQRDESALRALGPNRLLLVAEPTARRERERAAWLSSLCRRAENVAPEGRLELYGGRKRYLWFTASGAAGAETAPGSGECPAAMFR
jgi:4-amino-4-deoxy-L-arabinose transferase-like glycosyltransferase